MFTAYFRRSVSYRTGCQGKVNTYGNNRRQTRTKTIIITSQLPVESWYDAIGDPTVADAILDRIVHTAHKIELTGDSVRKINAKKK